MPADLYCIAYHSRIAWPRSSDEMAAETRSILETSRRNNRRDDVTGALMLSDGCFVQVLEGPRRNVQETFNRILRDARHIDVTLLQMTMLDERAFSDWSMGFVSDSTAVQQTFGAVATETGFDVAPLTTESLLNFFLNLLLRQAGRRPTATRQAVA